MNGALQRISVTSRRIASRLERHSALLLILLIVPALYPFYGHGLPQSADGALHLLRLVVLDHNIARGVPYPRWIPELVLGYGYPLFHFYGPSTYYLAEAVHLLGASHFTAFTGAFVILTVMAGIAMYVLAREIYGARSPRWAALIAALAYVYSPYLLINLYLRGAIAEVGAQALVPWIFFMFRRLMRSSIPSRWLLPASLTVAALAFTHTISLILVPPVLAAYLLFLWWQGPRTRERAARALLGVGMAMGLSAFFWIPVLAEREYLSDLAYRETIFTHLPSHTWTWRNFLDRSLLYDYSLDVPYQMGLLQLLLALAGFFAARRRDQEWSFFLALAIGSSVGVSLLPISVWVRTPVLLVVQFPWRFLALAGLALALLAGGLATRLPRRWYSPLLVAALLSLIIVANYPRFGFLDVFDSTEVRLTLPVVAQYERETRTFGASASAEFMPRWTDGPGVVPPGPGSSEDRVPEQVTFQAIAPRSWDIVVSASEPATLRLASLYYPAWRASLSDGTVLETFPDTSAGLLAIAVPPGTHQLRVSWLGTPYERAGRWISLATLFAVALYYWKRGNSTLRAGSLLLLSGALIFTFMPPPAPQPLLAPERPLGVQGLHFLSLSTERASPSGLLLYPHWYIEQPVDDLRLRWQLVDADGVVVGDSPSLPYYNTLSSRNWPAGILVDDAYHLSLAPGLPAGQYRLQVQVQDAASPMEGASEPGFIPVTEIALDAPVPRAPQAPSREADALFGGEIALEGYDLLVDGEMWDGNDEPVIVSPGAILRYRFYWHALVPIEENYHGFIQILDPFQTAITSRDHLLGSMFDVSSLWSPVGIHEDIYRLEIPDGAPSGRYSPTAGVYRFGTLERLAARRRDGTELGNAITLPPIKVLNPPESRPETEVKATFEEGITLLGYQLSLPEEGLRPGDTFTITLHYYSNGTPSSDYTRFVHLFDGEKGMAAQADGMPRDGLNPTSAWIAGEVIADPVTLTLSTDAPPGTYSLRTGLYDAASGGMRLPVRDEEGNPLPEEQVLLEEITVEPPR